jgi:hypothetical protein
MGGLRGKKEGEEGERRSLFLSLSLALALSLSLSLSFSLSLSSLFLSLHRCLLPLLPKCDSSWRVQALDLVNENNLIKNTKY